MSSLGQQVKQVGPRVRSSWTGSGQTGSGLGRRVRTSSGFWVKSGSGLMLNGSGLRQVGLNLRSGHQTGLGPIYKGPSSRAAGIHPWMVREVYARPKLAKNSTETSRKPL
ncbi:hypothetical protein V6N13_024957 [Hibiscus sabdariffa]